jgi:hypothetical protein
MRNISSAKLKKPVAFKKLRLKELPKIKNCEIAYINEIAYKMDNI